MNYDKNSFLAGISVGRTLKGWSGAAATPLPSSGCYISFGALMFGDFREPGYVVDASPVSFGGLTFGNMQLEAEQ